MSGRWPGWWAGRSLRARLMSIGLIGLAIVQAASSVALYTALSVASRHDLDRRAAATAQQVADLVTAHRLPDLRRLSRSAANDGYGRDPETVFPTGSWFRGGVYGPDVNFPIPIEELNNSNIAGPAPNTCIDRNP